MATELVANDITPDSPSHPGEMLAESLLELGISQRELARRIGRPPQAVSEIVRGRKRVTPAMALDFQEALGIPAHMWVNMQARYDLVTEINSRRQRAS